MLKYDFVLDDFQQRSVEAISRGNSVIVSAPTGAGKTVIAEYAVKQCLEKGEGIIYTAPVKALSNQKFRDFQELFPSRVGIVTGDVSINPDADILIMTTEIFRNRILENKSSIEKYSWIIFDEIHYIDDMDRGTVWEESLIFLPSHMRVLGLSATIPNISQFTGWLSSILNHTVDVVVEDKRPVPLDFNFQSRGKIVDSLKMVRKIAFSKKYANLSKGSKKNTPLTLIKHLYRRERLPCIYFAFSRKRCEFLAEKASEFDFHDEYDREDVLLMYDELVKRYNVKELERVDTLRELIGKGIAYHHAGIHPMIKEIVERLFAEKLIRVIFTTETFALGINMPARTVIMDELRKRYARSFKVIKNRDFFQMAGRSGRRGIDDKGFVYSRVDPFDVNFRELNALFTKGPEPVRSRFNASYATILNLYEKFGDKFLDIYPRSFNYYLDRNNKSSYQLRQMKQKIKVLKHMGYIENEMLTEKGHLGKKLYGYELILTELLVSGIMDKLTPLMLSVLLLAVVYEARPKAARPKLTRELKKLKLSSSEICKRVRTTEKNMQIFPQSKKLSFDLSFALLFWMENKPFNDTVGVTQHDEGEVIRYFRMCVQLIREMLNTELPLSFKKKLYSALEMIDRDDVDAEKQLTATIS